MAYCIGDVSRGCGGPGSVIDKLDSGFLQLATPEGSDFAIYEVGNEYLDDPSGKLLPVPQELCSLLDSARDYPPAMALTKLEAARARPESKDSFCSALAAMLRHYLRNQPTYPFFLAEVVTSNDLDLPEQSFVWIAAIDPNETDLLYVSWDYYFYAAPKKWFLIHAGKQLSKFKCYDFINTTYVQG